MSRMLKIDASTEARIKDILPGIHECFPESIATKMEAILNSFLQNREISYDDAYVLLGFLGYEESQNIKPEKESENEIKDSIPEMMRTSNNALFRKFQLLRDELLKQLFLQSAVLNKKKQNEHVITNILRIER